MLFLCLGVVAYILEMILIRRGSESLCRLRAVDPHPSDIVCSIATQTMNTNNGRWESLLRGGEEGRGERIWGQSIDLIIADKGRTSS